MSSNLEEDLDELLFGSPSSIPKFETQSQQQQSSQKLSSSTTTKENETKTSKNFTAEEMEDLLFGGGATNNNIENNNNNKSIQHQKKENETAVVIQQQQQQVTKVDKQQIEPIVTPTVVVDPAVLLLEAEVSNKQQQQQNENVIGAPPSSTKEEIFWFCLYATPSVALIITLLVLGLQKTPDNGVCNIRFGGKCQPLAFSSGGWNSGSVFSQNNPDLNMGCPSATQNCVVSDFQFNDAVNSFDGPTEYYSDDVYSRCWGNPEAVSCLNWNLPGYFPAPPMKITSNSSSMANSNSTTSICVPVDRIWMAPPISAIVAFDNITRPLQCCRYLPGGGSGASVTQIILKSIFGTLIDIALNALTSIPILARFINWILFPLNMLAQKLTVWWRHKKAKRKAVRRIQTRKKSVMQQKSTSNNNNETPLLSSSPTKTFSNSAPQPDDDDQNHKKNNNVPGEGSSNSSSSNENNSNNNKHSNSVDDAMAMNLLTANNQSSAVFDVEDAAADDLDDQADMVLFMQQYSETKEKEQQQMMHDLHLSSWVDEACFPSTLMIIKTISLAIFGVVLSATEITKSDYDSVSAWTRYNAYASNIINGAVFSAWLDIGVQFFIFYSTQTDIYRRPMQMSALAPITGMSAYVKFMFVPDPDHPAYKFFKYSPAVRWGVNLCWICYLAPYVTHICMSFFYYLPMVVCYFGTMVLGGGLVCVFVSKVFDIYGDAWRGEYVKRTAASHHHDDEKSNNTHNNKSLFWKQARTFFGRYLLMVMYSILVYYVYSLHCNWAVLLYDAPDRYLGASNYILVVWDELSIRQMGCQLMKLKEAMRNGDRASAADIMMNYFL